MRNRSLLLRSGRRRHGGRLVALVGASFSLRTRNFLYSGWLGRDRSGLVRRWPRPSLPACSGAASAAGVWWVWDRGSPPRWSAGWSMPLI